MSFRPFFMLASLLIGCSLYGQNPHPYFRNYTTEDGLPSPEVHYCLEDDDGFMWFATDNGISRFDGYEFKNYGSHEGLKDNVVLLMQKDSNGKIWLGTLSGRLYYIEQGTIIPYAHNNIISNFNEGLTLTDFVIDSTAAIFLKFPAKGILKINPDGTYTTKTSSNKLGGVFILETTERPIIGGNNCPDSLRQQLFEMYHIRGVLGPLEWHNDRSVVNLDELQYSNHPSSPAGVKALSGHGYLFSQDHSVHFIKEKKIEWSHYFPYDFIMKAVFEETDGQILAGLLKGGGIRRYKNLDYWRTGIYEQFLPGKSISHIFKDNKGGFWIATIEHGVFYCPDFEQKIYDQSAGLPEDNVVSLAFQNEEKLFIGHRKGAVWMLESKTGKLSQLPDNPYNRDIIFDIEYDDQQEVLWVANGRNAFWSDNRWQQVEFYNETKKMIEPFRAKHFSIGKNGQSLWAAGGNSFYKINARQKEVEMDAESMGLSGRIFIAMEDANGRGWIGNNDGIFEYTSGKLIRPNPFHEAFKTRVDDITEMSDGTLVIATKGEGLLFWRDTFFMQLTTKDNLLSNMIENVHVDENDRIWVGTLKGLNRIIFLKKPHGSPFVENFTTWHGLPSNEINQVRSYGDQIWIATTLGLMQWKEPRKNLSTKPPVLTEFTINNEPCKMSEDLVLSHDQNNVGFHFLTINYRQNGNIHYRHRLNNGKWQEIKYTSINFAQLPPDTYFFEVQSQNEDHVWSESAIFSFKIKPPWWQHTWFYVLSGLTLLSAAVIIYRYRMKVLKNEYELKRQLTDLEKSALQAQMNPHFIFNSLNSIQNFILQNDKKKAVEFLARFAKLIRHNLDASISGKVSLNQVVQMLENYLTLERERYNHCFEYEIAIADELIDKYIEFPSMLIQPFVENAIIHGMSGRDSGGKIVLEFSIENGQLLVKVSDNGKGYSEENKYSAGIKHKSAGMNITKKRLEMLGASKDNAIQVRALINEDGQINGTEVRVLINLNKTKP